MNATNKGLLLFIVAGVMYMASNKVIQARGVRNNNPLNIIKNGIKWVGLVPDSAQTDPRFFIFQSPYYGIRASSIIMDNYARNNGITTIRGLISRWSATDQKSYINSVSKAVNINPDATINLLDDNLKIKLIKAMIKVENGYNPYSDRLISDAVKGVE